MASSVIKRRVVDVYSQSVTANVTTDIPIKPYNIALLIVGNTNRTSEQTAMYVLFNNTSPLAIKESSGITVVSDSNTLTVTSIYNNSVTILYLNY